MKFGFLSSLSNWTRAHRLIASLCLGVLICILCAGAWFGWRQYQYMQTSQYALEKLKAAMLPPQPAELAKMADFNSISRDLTQAIIKNFPFYMAGPDQERNINHALQTALLRGFLSKEEPSRVPEPEESEEKALQRPLRILPGDFLSQLVQTLSIRQTDADSVLLGAKIENPQLGKPFTLIFAMRRGPDGWKLIRIANAQEIMAQLRAALIQRHNRLREVFEEKNAATAKKMNELLPIQSCSAHAGLISAGKMLIMTVHVLARNRGHAQVNNFSVNTEIIGKDGKPITSRFLNAAMPVGPGEDFSHRWSFELDSQEPLAQEIMNGIPVSCKASWQTLGLNNHQVWHIEEVPNPNRMCSLDGHDHPEGFCIMPVFQP